MGVNSCTFCGNFVETPKILLSKNGTTYTRFTLGVNSRVYDKVSKQWIEKASFLSFIAFDDIAREIVDKCVRGTKITVNSSCEQSLYKKGDETIRDIIFRVKSFEISNNKQKEWHSKNWI